MRFVPLWLALSFVVGCVAAPNSGTGVKRDGGTSAPDFAGQPGSGNCGSGNQACCAGQVCDTGLQCNPKTGGCCAPTGNACTGPGDCCAGLSCTGSKCCTAIGASCLSPGDCCAGLTCTNNVCDKPAGSCGSIGAACCTPGNTCTSGNVCVSGMCKACGQSGQACCDANTCNKGLNCTNTVCTAPCGDANGPCCKGATACNNASLTCDMVSGLCKSTTGGTTGGLNQPCTMPGNVCTAPLTCVANKCQQPQACNTVGATCCSGNVCQGGLTCNTGTNKCQMPATMCTDIQKLCNQTSQCCPNLTCLDTVQPDGSDAKSCCVGVGAACPDGDFDCCGFLVCTSGKCTAGGDGDSCLTNDDCVSKQCGTDGTCTSSAGMCGALKPVGSTCTDSSQCCNFGLCEKTVSSGANQDCCYDQGAACTDGSQCCGSMICDTANTKTCICRKVGETCLQDEDCCGDASFICSSGKCINKADVLSPPGGVCMTDNDCQDTNGTTYGCNNMNGSNKICCTDDLQISCSGDLECCGAAHCDYIHFYSLSKSCCSVAGGDCNVSDDCCTGFSCTDNTCS